MFAREECVLRHARFFCKFLIRPAIPLCLLEYKPLLFGQLVDGLLKSFTELLALQLLIGLRLAVLQKQCHILYKDLIVIV